MVYIFYLSVMMMISSNSFLLFSDYCKILVILSFVENLFLHSEIDALGVIPFTCLILPASFLVSLCVIFITFWCYVFSFSSSSSTSISSIVYLFLISSASPSIPSTSISSFLFISWSNWYFDFNSNISFDAELYRCREEVELSWTFFCFSIWFSKVN